MDIERLGNYIEETIITNDDLSLSYVDVVGITITKEIIPTKATESENMNLAKYKKVYPNHFIYNPRTHGKRIGFGFNDTNKVLLISHNNMSFKIKTDKENELLPRYLFMWLNRDEWDRNACFRSWGSSTEVFTWDELCDMQLYIPPIEIQKKYVAIYESMLKNLHTYEKGLDDLKLVCDGYIENMRKNIKPTEIGKYIKEINVKNNDDNAIIAGISNQQKFIKSESRTKGVDKNKYNVVAKGNFAYSPIHINEGSIAYNDKDTIIVSPIYKIFTVENEELDSEYLMMWFTRSEFIRYCWFHAFGSARDSFEWEQLCDVKIPIPNIDIQRNIVKVFNIVNKRKEYLNHLKTQIKNICPILIRGSIKECQIGA